MLEPPSNIINIRSGANSRLDGRIKLYAIATFGFTFFYLLFNLGDNIGENSGVSTTFLSFIELTRGEFETLLLILNAISLFRLGWRVLISVEYNNYYKAARWDFYGPALTNLKKENKEKYYEEKVDELYEDYADPLIRTEKYIVGLIAPTIAGLVIAIWLADTISHYLSTSLIVSLFALTIFIIIMSYAFSLCLFECLKPAKRRHSSFIETTCFFEIFRFPFCFLPIESECIKCRRISGAVLFSFLTILLVSYISLLINIL